MFDVFRSVVVPRATGRTLRLGPLIGDALLRLTLRFTGRHAPGPRHEVLGSVGPVVLLLQAMTWFFLLTVGFALAMHALPQGFVPPLTLTDAAYASASSFFTLGVTGHDVVSAWARTLVISAALCGFALVPLVVTFLLNIQAALTTREQLVLRIGKQDRTPPTDLDILQRFERFGVSRDAALEHLFEDWADWSAHVLLTHRAFPVLAYFRSTDQECDWLAALGAVLDAASLLATLKRGPATEHAVLCHGIGSRLAMELASTFRCASGYEPHLTQCRFDMMCARLQRSAASNAGTPSSLAVLNGMRDAYAPAINALCRHFGVKRAVQASCYNTEVSPDI